MPAMLAVSLIAMSSTCHPVHAETCLTALESTYKSKTRGRIEKIHVDNKQIVRVNNEIGKCVVNIQGYDGVRWYPGKAEYWFTPDLSANQACDKAQERAKVQIIQSVFPHQVDATTSLTCKMKDGKIIKQPKPIDKEFWTPRECRTVKFRKNIGYGTPPQCIKLYPWRYHSK